MQKATNAAGTSLDTKVYATKILPNRSFFFVLFFFFNAIHLRVQHIKKF